MLYFYNHIFCKIVLIYFIVTKLASVQNHTSSKVESPSIISQELVQYFTTLVIHNSIRQQISQK